MAVFVENYWILYRIMQAPMAMRTIVIMISHRKKSTPVSNHLILMCTHMPEESTAPIAMVMGAEELVVTTTRPGIKSNSRCGHQSISTTEGFDNLTYVTNTFPKQCTFWKPSAPIEWPENAALDLCIFPNWGEIPRLRNIVVRPMYGGGVICH